MLNYQQYYTKCRESYSIGDNPSIQNLGIDVNTLTLPESIKGLAEKVKYKFDNKIGIRPQALAVKLYDVWDIDELYDVGKFLNDFAQNEVYGCYSYIEHIHIYQNVITKAKEDSSWKWHYDDSSDYQFKIMIYLSKVEEGNGEFIYVVNKDKKPVRFRSSKIGPNQMGTQVFQASRIPPKHIEKIVSEGGEVVHVLGDVGTNIVFQQNNGHKASIPSKEPPRNVIIYNFRPYHKEVEPINQKYTYAWNNSGSVKKFNTSIT